MGGLYLLDYGAGNVQSLANSLERLGHKFERISSPGDFDKASKLIFPGVGAFQTAIDHLASSGLLEPLRAYIKSGRPYLGICIGMQVLFESSAESPGARGLGIVPAPIARFGDADKAVPHMGWNAARFLDGAGGEGMDERAHYYFVHSYRAAYDPDAHPDAAAWTHTTAQYGQEVFVASVRRGSVFGTQFHPEKSGAAGLALLDSWLREPAGAPSAPRVARVSKTRGGLTKPIIAGIIIACMAARARMTAQYTLTKRSIAWGIIAGMAAYTTAQYVQGVFVAFARRRSVYAEKSGAAGLAPPPPRVARVPEARDGLTKRIIACMDVRANDAGDLVVTKGDQYDVREKAPAAGGASALAAQTAGAVRNLGKPVALAERYADAGADELCLLNITSFRQSPLRDQPMLAVVRAVAKTVAVPLTIGGGIKDTVDPDGTPRSALEVAGLYFRAGADKVSIGSEAVLAVERMRARPDGSGDGTSAIETIARVYGNQAVVVSVDPRRAYVDPATYDGPRRDELIRGAPDGPEDERGKAWWYQCTVSGGREARDLSVVELARGAARLGAGEILLNSIDRDGTGRGFDLELVQLVKRAVSIPVVASSGAGSAAHFVDVFAHTDVESALAAGIFHRGEVQIEDVKRALRDAGINARS